MSKKLIVFDFDGTMVDSLSYYLNEAKGYFPKHEDKLNKDYVHTHGVEALFKSLSIPKFVIPLILIYVRFRHNHILKKLKPHNDIGTVLKKLNKDHVVGIVSSNSKKTIKVFLKNNRLSEYVSFVDSSPFYFGKSKNLKKWRKKYPDLTKACYIGDEERDIKAAHQAGFVPIGVAWGVESQSLLKHSNPKFIVKSAIDILKVVNEI